MSKLWNRTWSILMHMQFVASLWAEVARISGLGRVSGMAYTLLAWPTVF